MPPVNTYGSVASSRRNAVPVLVMSVASWPVGVGSGRRLGGRPRSGAAGAGDRPVARLRALGAAVAAAAVADPALVGVAQDLAASAPIVHRAPPGTRRRGAPRAGRTLCSESAGPPGGHAT